MCRQSPDPGRFPQPRAVAAPQAGHAAAASQASSAPAALRDGGAHPRAARRRHRCPPITSPPRRGEGPPPCPRRGGLSGGPRRLLTCPGSCRRRPLRPRSPPAAEGPARSRLTGRDWSRRERDTKPPPPRPLCPPLPALPPRSQTRLILWFTKTSAGVRS